jgi:D-sedoheptulose 7-phosphate isomerase
MTSPRTGDSALAKSLDEAATLLHWLQQLEAREGIIAATGHTLAACLEQGGRILSCGNGGSMCDAMHFAQELSGHFRGKRRALAAQSISDPSHLTCAANDEGFDTVFARGVEAWGKPGDALVALSTSGNSRNVIAAVHAARAIGMTTVGLLGRDGGQLKALCDVAIVVPGTTSDRIQEVHIKIVHLLIEQIERRLFATGP